MRNGGCFTWLYRLILGAFFLYLLPGFTVALCKLLAQLWSLPELFWPIAGGFAAGIAVEAYFLSNLPEIGAFEHELTHSVCALLLFRRVSQFRVFRGGGGYMEHSGGCGGLPGNDLISLAPYIFPTLTIACVLALPLIPEQWVSYYSALIGITAGYHAMSTITETTGNWRDFLHNPGRANDFANAGPIFSAIVAAPASIAVHGMLIAAVLDWQQGLPYWLDTSVSTSRDLFPMISNVLTT